jgi:prepilin-type N-terminal cleavage/methylation domain-containing protein
LNLMVRNLPFRRPLRRALEQAGYTLIETLVAMSLLVIVIGALADGFTSASKTQTDQTARADDQESARLALDRLRRDIHCASAGSVSERTAGDPTQGYTLNLTVNPNQCLAVTAGGGAGVAVGGVASDGVQWCTVPISGATNRYAMYRTVVTTCDAADAVFQVDYVTEPQVWDVVCGANQSNLETVSIDLEVNRDIETRPDRTYALTDRITLRNDTAQTGAQSGLC